MLTLGLALLYPQLLKVHIGSVKDTTRVPGVGALVAHEASKLSGLDLPRRLTGMVLSMQVTAELSPSDTRLAEMGSNLSSDLIAGVVNLNLIVVLALHTRSDQLPHCPARRTVFLLLRLRK